MCHITAVHECACVRGEGGSGFERSMNASCHTSMSHVTYMNESYYRCTWVCMRDRGGRVCLSARWMSHVTQINESCHTYECVTLMVYMNVYAWEGRASWFEHSMNASCHVDQWVMSHIWMCHITRVHECVCVILGGDWVWALDEWVMSHINESCHIYECVTL